LLVASCATVQPPTTFTTSSPGSVEASATPTRSSSAEPSPSSELVHYANAHNALELDYPSSWRVIAENDIRIGQYTYVVLGTGDWTSGCTGSAGCDRPDTFITDPGEIVAHLSYFYSGPAFQVFAPPPFEAQPLASGLVARIADGPDRTDATVFIPGAREMTVDVRYGGEPSSSVVADVHAMIASVEAVSEALPNILTQDAREDRPDCADDVLRGRLARGDLGGPHLAAEGQFGIATLHWPHGWTSRLDESHRARIFDRNGALVAREWDEVELGGRGDNNEFLICEDAIEVLRAYP
jgi:hypothetical protein